MIRPDAKLHGKSSFREWASLFSGKYFAMIACYADETGTGGIPKAGKEPAPGFYGFLATPADWEDFRLNWDSMLKKHDAPYFHFRELDPNFQKKNPGNHFSTWNKDRKDDFIYDMAFVASSKPIPFGGNAAQKRLKNANEAYENSIEMFFGDFSLVMDRHFPNEKSQVSFFFSDHEIDDWLLILNKKIKEARLRDRRIAGEYTPIEPKSERGMPCQAADLLAFVNRQNMETVYDKDRYIPQRILDVIVARQGFPDWHPFAAIKKMGESDWKNLIAELRGRKKQFDLKHELLGTKPKPQFYPIQEHPYFTHLSQLCYEHKAKHPKLWA